MENIDLYLPNLKKVKFETNSIITDKTMFCLSRMRCLSEITLKITHDFPFKEYAITDASIDAILENHINTRYRKLWIESRSINISKELIERIISIAENNTKTRFEYKFYYLENLIRSQLYFYYDKPIYKSKYEESALFKYKIPKNLNINL